MNKLKFTIRLLIATCFLIGSYVSQAQKVIKPKLEWGNKFTGGGTVDVNKILMEKAEMDNVVHAAGYRGTIDFDPGPANLDLSTAMNGLYIWKGDKDGKLLWVKTINYEEMSPLGFPQFQVTALSVDQENGDIYLSGIFGDTTIDFDPGPGVSKMVPENTLFGTYYPSLFILKLNANGDFQWVRQLAVFNGGGIMASSIAQHVSGENRLIYFTGYAQPFMDYDIFENIPYDFDPGPGTAYIRPQGINAEIGYILCLNDRGEFVWVKSLAEGGDAVISFRPLDMAVNKNSIFVLGSFAGTVDVNPAPAVYNIVGNYDLLLLKYDLNGALEWVRQSEVGSTVVGGAEELSNISFSYDSDMMGLDEKGNVYFAVSFNGPVNFNKMMPWGGPATIINAPYYPRFTTSTTTALVRYSNNGNFEWIKVIGGTDTVNRTSSSHLSIAKDGKLYLSGNYANSVDLDPGPDSFLLTGSSNIVAGVGGNAYIAQYDTTGNFIWGGKIPDTTTATSYVRITNIESEEGDSIYLTGYWRGGAIDFDPGPAEFILTPADDKRNSAFLLKLKIIAVDTTEVEDTTTSIKNSLLALDIKVYPNPTIGLLDIESSRSFHNAAITITNITGQVVFQKADLKGNKFRFDLKTMAAGTYVLELWEGNYKRSYKLQKR